MAVERRIKKVKLLVTLKGMASGKQCIWLAGTVFDADVKPFPPDVATEIQLRRPRVLEILEYYPEPSTESDVELEPEPEVKPEKKPEIKFEEPVEKEPAQKSVLTKRVTKKITKKTEAPKDAQDNPLERRVKRPFKK